MAKGKKEVSVDAPDKSPRGLKSPRAEQLDGEVPILNVEFSIKNPVEINSVEELMGCLEKKEEVISIDNDFIESLDSDLSFATCKRLVIVGTDSHKIEDEDGSLFPILLSKLESATSIRTLVLSGHTFNMLHFPTEFPEKITTLIFDNCTIEDIEYEENAAPPLHTLVFQKILSLSHFVFPQHACYSLTQLKLTRLACKSMTFEEGCMSEGNYLEISGCKYLEEVDIADNSFEKTEYLSMSRNVNLIRMNIGKKCFSVAGTWDIICTELRILTLGGENFTNVQEVDLTPMSELTEVTIGNGTFSSGVTLICEQLTKLKVLDIGNYCFENGQKLYFINTVNLRQLSFGKRTFRGLVSSALTMCDMPRLESLSFGDSCLSKLDRFVLLKNQCLKNLTFGKGCLKNCQYFVLLNYLNRVHIEEHDGKVTFIPEEYPGLPQEAEILCQPGSFRIEVCPRLQTVEFGKDCLPSIKHFEMSFLRKLRKLVLPPHFAEDCETFMMSDNPKLDTIEIPEGCFRHCNYFSLQNHPELQSLIIEKNVMAEGGFAIMRNLYPTTISVDKSSFLLSAASYKSIPNKLRRAITKNLTKFQAKIASDAFLGQALVDTIGVVGVVAAIIIFLI